MSQNRRYIVCGNADFEVPPELQDTALYYHTENKGDRARRVTLEINDFLRPLCQNVPERFLDLLEIATYVYCADQEATRGTDQDSRTFCSHWRRDFHFVIPVRDLTFWLKAKVQAVLTSTLGFLSDDRYMFTFVKQTQSIPFQQFFDFNDDGSLLGTPEQVIMFSGGLDSLGGAIQEIINQKRRVVLVNHRPTTKLNRKHQKLVRMLEEKASDSCKPTSIRVKINKKSGMNKEYTQRSRSFLYVTIGATISKMLDLQSVRFYENGIVSLNLPVCEHVVGGKATRTTHPRVIEGFAEILTMVSESDFTVENPFIDKTKGEVVKLIASSSCSEMIAASISCSHTWEMKEGHWHCGTCSQCIDRRFAVAAAGLEEKDPLDQYAVDVFTETRQRDVHIAEDKTMYAGYLERANQAQNIADCAEFAARFPEVLRAVRHLSGDAGQVIDRIFDMYKRHSEEINRVIDNKLREHATAIRQRTLPADCLVRIIHESYLPTSISAIPIVAEELPENVFRWQGGAWQVRFSGQRYFRRDNYFLVYPQFGASYLQYLLGSPNQALSSIEIACSTAVDVYEMAMSEQQAISEGLSVTKHLFKSDLGAISDLPAIKEYRAKVSKLLVDIENARTEDTAENKLIEQECLEEMIAIEREIQKVVGFGGRLKRLQDKRKNIQDRFRNNVNRVIDKIRMTDPAFANHLKESISFGINPKYAPQCNISWDTAPIPKK